MYPKSDNTIVTTTAIISTRSFQEGAFEPDCEIGGFIEQLPRTSAEHLINTHPEKLHAK